jgi:hypothetical protein
MYLKNFEVPYSTLVDSKNTFLAASKDPHVLYKSIEGL